MQQNAVVFIDVECIGNPEGFRSRMDGGIKFGEFELGWAAAWYQNGEWHRISGHTPIPLKWSDIMVRNHMQLDHYLLIDSIKTGNINPALIHPYAKRCLEWWMSQGMNQALAHRIKLACEVRKEDFLLDLKQRLQPVLTNAASIWSSEMPLDTCPLIGRVEYDFYKKRCFRTARKTLNMLKHPDYEGRHQADVDAEMQLESLIYNAYDMGIPHILNLDFDTPAPESSFYQSTDWQN